MTDDSDAADDDALQAFNELPGGEQLRVLVHYLFDQVSKLAPPDIELYLTIWVQGKPTYGAAASSAHQIETLEHLRFISGLIEEGLLSQQDSLATKH